MASKKKTLQDFLTSRWGIIVVFILVFYLMTFLVYYFYSPGPEARRMAELASQTEVVSDDQLSQL